MSFGERQKIQIHQNDSSEGFTTIVMEIKKGIISSPGNIFESFKNHLALLFPIRKTKLKKPVIKIECFRCP